jgi:two-component system chemotaxis response regulator CheB
MAQHRRILIVDSSKYFDNSMWRMLIPEGEFEIVGPTNTTDETLTMAFSLVPDVILVDLARPASKGLKTVSTLRSVYPYIPIITFMPISSEEYTRASLNAGASACVPKAEVADVLLQTMQRVGTQISVPN